jgi:hypothetical protein
VANRATRRQYKTGLALATVPRTQSRKPARNVSAKVFILCLKTPPQRRLFIKQDKQMKAHPNQKSVFQHLDIPKQKSLPKDHRFERQIHWIPHIPVKPADHQMPRRKNRRRRSQSLQRESSKRIQQDRKASQNQQNSEPSKKRKTKQRSLHPPARNPPGHKSSHGSGRKQQEEDRTQNRRHSPHRTQRDGALPDSSTAFTPYFDDAAQVEYPAGVTASECRLSRFTM